MKVYIVAHGETGGDPKEPFQGKRDIPLNDTGRKQARKTAAYFSDKGIKVVYSSPLARAFDTARIIADSLHVPVEVKEELSDMAFGRWEGLPLTEIEKTYPLQLTIWREWPQKFRITGAESLTGVRKRIIVGLNDMLDAGHDNLLLISHPIICKLMILHLLGIASEHLWKIHCPPLAITLINRVDGRVTVEFMNEACHLTKKP